MGPVSFLFDGEVPASKSLLNRALIISSYAPDLKIIGDSSADDVRYMRNGLAQLASESSDPIDCGHAGTVLRFLSLRAVRRRGQYRFVGSERLFSRPLSELTAVLGQLGVSAELRKVEEHSEFSLRSDGWRLVVDGLQVNADRSSQFASAVILNSWNLNFALHFSVSKKIVSEGYLHMTYELARQMGMRISQHGNEFIIPANQKVTAQEIKIEPDLSSAFAVAALAVVDGEATIRGFPRPSLQPDAIFVRILENMKADVSGERNELKIRKSHTLQGVTVDLENSPDLFPVLAVLCALAKSPSQISGIGHLRYKESSRLERTTELLRLMGARVEGSENAVTITPVKERPVGGRKEIFDVDQDHRMAMAVAVAERAGFQIQGNEMQVIAKSFPEFVQLLGGVS
jgi:3-phosphoshikimate 1-carboxyvinyltransferase